MTHPDEDSIAEVAFVASISGIGEALIQRYEELDRELESLRWWEVCRRRRLLIRLDIFAELYTSIGGYLVDQQKAIAVERNRRSAQQN